MVLTGQYYCVTVQQTVDLCDNDWSVLLYSRQLICVVLTGQYYCTIRQLIYVVLTGQCVQYAVDLCGTDWSVCTVDS